MERKEGFKIDEINFNSFEGLTEPIVLAIVVDADTERVLIPAYMNREALTKTCEIGQVVFWSRGRKEEWHKGATSGNYYEIKRIEVNCELDAVLIFAKNVVGGPACHTGEESCFDAGPFIVFDQRYATTLKDRQDK